MERGGTAALSKLKEASLSRTNLNSGNLEVEVLLAGGHGCDRDLTWASLWSLEVTNCCKICFDLGRLQSPSPCSLATVAGCGPHDQTRHIRLNKYYKRSLGGVPPPLQGPDAHAGIWHMHASCWPARLYWPSLLYIVHRVNVAHCQGECTCIEVYKLMWRMSTNLCPRKRISRTSRVLE